MPVDPHRHLFAAMAAAAEASPSPLRGGVRGGGDHAERQPFNPKTQYLFDASVEGVVDVAGAEAQNPVALSMQPGITSLVARQTAGILVKLAVDFDRQTRGMGGEIGPDRHLFAKVDPAVPMEGLQLVPETLFAFRHRLPQPSRPLD
ncbi:hypothetical protein ATO4_13005 [Aurantimonas sp. 22II-16-19i]|nr:hypothetical protein ATO4_13005 [Aurantimonas sp. 22II-16-19i]